MRKTIFLLLLLFWCLVFSWWGPFGANKGAENRTQPMARVSLVEYRQDLALKSLLLLLAVAAVGRMGWVKFNHLINNQIDE